MAAFDPPYKFVYPPEWSDRERMHYLLAPFPPNKTLTAQEPKITFWSNLIKTSSQELRRPLFTERELQARFKWNEVTSPSCLSHVISSMERIREVTKMSEIRQAVQQERVGWVSWGVGMIGKPVSWAVKNYLSSGAVNVDEEYVVVATVKELANRILTEQQKAVEYQSTDRVMKHSNFVDLCKKVVGTAPDAVSVVELWLLKEKVIVKAKQGNQEIVKFCQKGEPLTETDVGILSIKESVGTLSNQVSQLQERSVQLKQIAVEQFKAKNKKGALNLLRRQKVIEASLNKREGALDNLQNILHQIQMAETDSLVYEAYKRGTKALKSLRESSGFTIDDIDEVGLSLQEALEDNQEISDALNQVSITAQEEDMDLEAELMAFLETDKSKAASAVPTTKQIEPATEDELEARLAALTLGGGVNKLSQNVTEPDQDKTLESQLQSRQSEGERSRSTTKKLPAIPA